MSCITCGRVGNHDHECIYCKNKRGNGETVKPRTLRHANREHFHTVLPICQSCEHWKPTGCGGCKLHPIKACDTVKDLLDGHPCFADQPKFPSAWKGPKESEILDSNCMVISAADSGYIRGAYFLAWTLLRANNVRMTIYLDVVSPDEPHVKQMRSWGVQFKPMPLAIPRDVDWYQTWNKPACILDAMASSENVLWIDSDAAVSQSVSEAFEIIDDKFFVPDHGIFIPTNGNDKEIHDLFGPPKQNFIGQQFPCAGIVGVQSSRDRDLVHQWHDRCITVADRPELWENARKSPLKFYDQGVLQDLVDVLPVDGEKWNRLSAPRRGSVSQQMRWIYSRPEMVITHYGGPMKPWDKWSPILKWGDPRCGKP